MTSGPGSYDANGVWIYGEADNADGTASGLLNLGEQSISVALGKITATIFRVASAAARDVKFGVPATSVQRLALEGALCVRTDTGLVERYYSNLTDNASGGTTTAGWYPIGVSPWTTYTATLTNFTMGAGTQLVKFRRVGEDVELRGRISISNTGTISGGTALQVSLPTGLDMNATEYPDSLAQLGQGSILQNGIRRPLQVSQAGANRQALFLDVFNAAGAVLDTQTITNGSPFTIGANPIILAFQARYKA
jgi:hypothetical protein